MIAIIVFSLVDKRAGFSNPEVVGSNPCSVKFFFFFLLFFFFKYIENVLGSNIAPPPHTFFLIFLILYNTFLSPAFSKKSGGT